MKRSQDMDEDPTAVDERKKRKCEYKTGFGDLDEDLLFEVLKHLDARSLATAACVSKQWHKTGQDERLWELVCTRHWAKIGCQNQQLRSVVLALGGFRRLHSLGLWPLLKPSPLPPPTIATPSNAPTTHWGKDEMNLSLSLLSIRYYKKMNLNMRGR